MRDTLRRIQQERKSELEALDIEIKPEQRLIVTRERATRLNFHATTTQIERIVQRLIEKAQVQKAEAVKRKQVNLFEETK